MAGQTGGIIQYKNCAKTVSNMYFGKKANK
jgi:hypothetical protein